MASNTIFERALYRGFSTLAQITSRGKSFKTRDVETVKTDLLNHIWTIKGERVMQPNFGTRIPLMAYEPLDDATLKIIRDDLTEVFTYDPRVELVEIAILPMPDNNAIVAFVDILYIELEVTETLKLEFPVGS